MESRVRRMMHGRPVRIVAQSCVVALCLFMAIGPGSAASADDFSSPPPRMLELLRREHDPRHRLLVTTSAARFDVNVGAIGEEGLREVTAIEPSSVLGPTSIPWASIARIERVELKHRRGRSAGLVLGALAGGFAGAALGRLARTKDVKGDRTYADFGAFVGTAAGASTGVWLGVRSKIRRSLYEAGSLEGSSDPQSDLSEPLIADLGESASRFSPRQIVRLRGSFGEYTGRISGITAEGRVSLDRVPDLDSALPISSGTIAWDEIRRIERRGTYWRRSALTAGIVTGLLFGSIGAFVEGVSSDYHLGLHDEGDAFWEGAIWEGTLVGAGVGVGLGAIFGALAPRWHRIVERPLIAPMTAEPARQ